MVVQLLAEPPYFVVKKQNQQSRKNMKKELDFWGCGCYISQAPQERRPGFLTIKQKKENFEKSS
ncbi:MAG: hypothetical protein J6W44_00830 [Oscillospiraceae bacterium]|nr:hypothetical protein [Oscillospiraceae bacterium]